MIGTALGVIGLCTAGAGLGALVTLHAEVTPPWNRRWRRTRLRLANLPLIGPPIFLAGAVLALTEGGSTGLLTMAFGLGASVQAPLMGFAAPLAEDD